MTRSRSPTDLRHAFRTLRRSPGLVLVTALSVGLGVGANTTVFAWMESLILRPLPAVRESDRMVRVNTRSADGSPWSVSWPDFVDWRAGSRTLDGLVAEAFTPLSLRSDGAPGRVFGLLTSGDYFEVLGARPVLGRGFLPDEERAAAPVAVISHALWSGRFRGDSSIVGRHVLLNGHDVTIVGVAPPRFGGLYIGLAFDVWLPATLHPVLTGHSWLHDRGNHFLEVAGRLKPGITLEAARADLDALARRTHSEQLDGTGGDGAIVRPLAESGPAAALAPAFGALLALSAVVLLVACANVAGILLARTVARRREVAVRLALGAGRARIVRQLLAESLLLGAGAGLVGIPIAAWGGDLLEALLPATPYPIAVATPLDARVLLFGAAVTAVAALAFGLAPALRATRPDIAPSLRDGAGDLRPSRARAQSTLVVAQMALSLAVLVTAGLFVRSLESARTVDPGFGEPRQVQLVDTDLTMAGRGDSAAADAYWRVLERVRALPGVTDAAWATMVPLGLGGNASAVVEPEGYVPPQGDDPAVELNRVSQRYFETMRVPILRGRGISAADRAGGALAVVVNEAFARRYWPGREPLGRTVRYDGRDFTVVGVARDGKYRDLAETPHPFIYFALAQVRFPRATLHVRAAGAPGALSGALREAFADVDPNLPYLDPRTLAEHTGAATTIQRIAATMLAGLGVVALLLAAVGLFGVVSYGVSRRTRDIGVRIALGASRADVFRVVLGEAARLSALGLAVGLVLAALSGFLVRGLLFGVGALDPASIAGAAATLSAVAALAAWLPARRASLVDPMIALRSD